MPENKNNFDPIVKTTDEHGNTHTFKLFEIVEIDKQEYGLFEYLDPEDKNKFAKSKNQDEDELVVMRIMHKADGYYFEIIEDDAEFNKVIAYIDEHEDELEFE